MFDASGWGDLPFNNEDQKFNVQASSSSSSSSSSSNFNDTTTSEAKIKNDPAKKKSLMNEIAKATNQDDISKVNLEGLQD